MHQTLFGGWVLPGPAAGELQVWRGKGGQSKGQGKGEEMAGRAKGEKGGCTCGFVEPVGAQTLSLLPRDPTAAYSDAM